MAKEGDIIETMFQWMIELFGWILKMLLKLAVWVLKMLWQALVALVGLLVRAFKKEQPNEQQTADPEKPIG
jgi:hypothetical protein